MRYVVVIVIALVLCVPSSEAQGPLLHTFTYSRAQIEMLPFERGQPILDWLDGARVAADRVMSDFASDRSSEAYAEMTETNRLLGAGFDRASFEQSIAKSCGRIVGGSFQGQELYGTGEWDDLDLTQLQSKTYYVLETTRRTKGKRYLEVDTIERNGSHRAVAVWVKYGIPDFGAEQR